MREWRDLPPLPRREPGSHKGTYGRVLLLCGSESMTGAAILAARAAYRAGTGLAVVGMERSLFGVVSPAAPEAIFLDTGNPDRALSAETLAAHQAVLVGPGLGPAKHDLVLTVLERRAGPLVLDADGLNAVAEAPSRPLPPREDRIWTPHPGEFQRLTGEKPSGDAERLAAAERFVRARGGVLVLKGHRTVVMDRERWAINETGNPGMATAGSGDVLSGMLAAFLGQGMPPFEAARAAVHLHGVAGDLAAAELGPISLIASDIIEKLPAAIRGHPSHP